MSKQAEICLIDMPFSILTNPAFGVSLLKAEAIRKGISCVVEYGSIEFSKYVDYSVLKSFQEIAVFYSNAIEIVFEPYSGFDEYSSWEETMDFLKKEYAGKDGFFDEFLSILRDTKDKVEKFLDEFSDKILSYNPKIVGATWGFQQCNSSLAILKKLKEKNPDIVTFIGGCSVSEYAGQAVIDNSPFVDYVFVGESDDIFVECINMMIEKNDDIYNKYSCILKKGGKGEQHAVEDLNNIAYPDYDDYFNALENSPLKGKFNLVIPVESSRGCWWGCKGKCNFCGLHTTSNTIKFREKDINRFVEEIRFLRDKYKINKIYLTDCILSRKYIKELPDLVENEGFNFFCEIKSNMTKKEVEDLKRAGFSCVQPGIEGINDGILKHINKGNKAIKHLEFLKNARESAIIPCWNLMKIFPGEENSWYVETANLIPLVVHYWPPNKNKYIHQKNSKFRQMAIDMGIEVVPSRFYKYYFAKQLGSDPNFHEMFEEVINRSNKYHKMMDIETDKWRDEFVDGHILSYYFVNNIMAILDTRNCATNGRYAFDGLEKEVLMGCDQVIKRDQLVNNLSDYDCDKVNKVIDDFIENKLIVQIGDDILFLGIKKNRESLKYDRDYAFGILNNLLV